MTTATASVKRPAQVGASLNLLPVMNLVTILIPLLLMSAQLVSLAVIDTHLPSIGELLSPLPGQDVQVSPSLVVTRQGVIIRGAEDVLTTGEARLPCRRQPCLPEDYDYAGVRERLIRVKEAHPGAMVVILVPEETIPYEVLVALMDAAREINSENPLFPMVTIAGGAPG